MLDPSYSDHRSIPLAARLHSRVPEILDISQLWLESPGAFACCRWVVQVI